MSDTIQIEFAGNDKLKAHLGVLKVGDEFEFTVTGVVKELNEDNLKGSLLRIELPEDEPGESTEVSSDEPASVVLKTGSKSKSMYG